MGLFDSIRRVVGGGESATDDGDGTPSGLVDTSTLDVAALRQHAEDVAGEVEQLDFSLDSLAQFDSAIDAGYDEELATSEDPATYATDVVRFGCYLGEVLVRRYDGEWTKDPQWGVTITGSDDSATVSVFEVAKRSIETKAVFAAVTERAAEEVGLDGEAVEPDDADAESPPDDGPDNDHLSADPSDDDSADPPDTEPGTDSPDAQADTAPGNGSPTLDAEDWEASDAEPEAPVSDDDTEPADASAASLDGDTDSDADSVPSSSDEIPEETDSTQSLEGETESDADSPLSPDDAPGTDQDPAATEDETAISEVAESEYGFEFESAAAEGTDPAATDTAPGATDTEADGSVESDETSAPTDAGGTEESDETVAESSEGAPDAATETDDAAALVEEAEPDAAEPDDSEAAGSESLFDEAESAADDAEPDTETPEAATPVEGDDSTEADDPTQGDGLRAEYAAEAEAFVSFWNERDLDYTPESLDRLDDLVAAEWDDDRFDDADFGSEASFDDRAFTSVSRELGSYFGEVLVRELDGEWTDETTNDSVVITGPDGPLAIPVFRVAGTSLKERPVFARSYDSLLSDIEA